MNDVLLSFWALLVLMAIGFILVKTKVVTPGADRALSKLVFAAMLPALMFKTVSTASPAAVFSIAALANIATAILVFAAYFILARRVFRLPAGEDTIGALCASYVNAGNIGIPYLVAVLGDATQAVPIMLFQLLVMVPITFTMLDRQTGRNLASPLKQILGALRQPPVVGVLLGLAASLLKLDVPQFVTVPVNMLAGVTVPIMMIAMGISWGTARIPKFNRESAPMLGAVAMRVFLSPLLTLGIGLALGLQGAALLAVLIVGVFPTANNVFVYAHRYEVGVPLARDANLLSTVLSMPMVLLITWVFHAFALV